MQQRIQNGWLERGVTIVDRATTWIESDCMIGSDTVVHPFSHISCGARIGDGCRIGPFALVAEQEEVTAGDTVGPVSTAGASFR